MPSTLPKLFLARHGDTAWTDSHQHTGRTDLPLNERGVEHARPLGERLRGFSFVRVFTRKGRFKELLERIPLHAITTRAALLGAATHGLDRLKDEVTR